MKFCVVPNDTKNLDKYKKIGADAFIFGLKDMCSGYDGISLDEIKKIYLENSNSESHFNPVKDSFEIYKLFFKFILAGLSSFILDYLLFYIFSLIIGGTNSILYSTICARVLSSIYNFLVNSNVVFKNRNSSSLIKYACLCIIQMFVSGLAVEYIVKLTHISSMVIKLIVDIVLFIVNFVIQRTFIFVGDKHEK